MRLFISMMGLLALIACEDGASLSLDAEDQVLMTSLSGEEEDYREGGFTGEESAEDEFGRPPLFRECDARADFEALFEHYDADASRSLEGSESEEVEEDMGGCSRGQDHHRQGQLELLMLVYDLDADGELSESEKETLFADFTARCEALHDQLLADFDADGDGELSEDEQEAAREAGDAMREEHRAAMDECRPEMGEEPPPPPWMVEFDSDADGELSESELDALRDAMRERLTSGEPPGEPPC